MFLSHFLDRNLEGKSPSCVVCITVGALFAAKVFINLAKNGNVVNRFHMTKWRVVRFFAEPIIRKEVKKSCEQIKMPSKKGEYKARRLPEHGFSEEEVLGLVKEFHEDLDKPFDEGTLSGAVYHGGKSHTDLLNRVIRMFLWSNPLHSDVFGAVRKMEAEVVSMVLHMFNGHLLPDACGTLTSGGTESIIMALKAYRDWARDTRGIKTPSIIMGITAHPAFDKGAEYFGIDLVKIPVDPVTKQVNPREMEKYIKYNTIAIVGSAPTFPHGVIDPIEELSEIACRHNIGLHVDCCLGGFIVPFMEKAGFSVPIVDFRFPGVTSISCDTHKYGFAPKGTSTVLYRTQELRSYQFCCVADWPGGMYCSPAVCGSKNGSVIAGAWASMVRLGEKGYIDCCRKIVEARIKMTDALSQLPYIYIIGKPSACVFAFGSDVIDIFILNEGLRERGWFLNCLQFPSGLQFSVTLLQANDGVVERFIKDVSEIGGQMYKEHEEAVNRGDKRSTASSKSTLYGSQQKISDRTIIQDVMKEFLNRYYSTEH
uniref:sphinganine-1-phosphate aldolase n=1 Tax=Trypanosoma congolense (strain IL3000) TaxID=1068625 RepID=G0UNV7_TRYCI|nr:putative sphingosine phosphate lyase-like protein [Trypanosoma congolense IL3000]